MSIWFENTDSLQEESAEDSTDLQRERSLIERKIHEVKLWKSVSNNNVHSNNKQTAQDHTKTLEDEMDAAITWVNLNFLDREGRLDTIPKKNSRNFGMRIITDETLVPDLRLPKQLSDDHQQWPEHIRNAHVELTSIVPPLRQLLNQRVDRTRAPALCTNNVFARAEHLLRSGYVKQVSVGAAEGNNGMLIISGNIFASFKNITYMTAVAMMRDSPLYAYACSCSNG